MRRTRRWLPAAAICLAGTLALASVAQATFPGRNGRIAFVDYVTGQLFTIHPDGHGLRKLTDFGPKYRATTPDWAPGGGQLIFALQGDNRIWTVRADGTDLHPLANDTPGFRDMAPTYTPSGRQIVFARCQPGDGVCAIWKMHSDGSHKRALTPYRTGQDETVDFDPAVSPNGKRIAFARFFGGGFSARVFVMGINGSHPHAITPARLEAFSPDWAPNGRRIAVGSAAPRLGSSIYTIKPNGKGVRRVGRSHFPNNDFQSVYSPDGKRFAFNSDRRYKDLCCVDLFTMGLKGGRQRLVNRSFRNHGILSPVWESLPR